LKVLTNLLDVFYPPFRKIMPIQTFRYAACGGANTLLGLAVYFVCLRYIFAHENFDAGFMIIKPENASLIVSSFVTFIVGFLLNKYVVFTSSFLRGRVQFIRYLMSFAFNFFLNYLLLNLFVQKLHAEKFLAQVISIAIVISFSYFTQKHFTFKEEKKDG
jgi:putative flippase GtrA